MGSARLNTMKGRLNSTGMQEQIRKSSSAVQITTQCVRLRGEVSQSIRLAGGKEDIQQAREVHAESLREIESFTDEASARVSELHFKALDQQVENLVTGSSSEPYSGTQTAVN